jgi:hypothetical protein
MKKIFNIKYLISLVFCLSLLSSYFLALSPSPVAAAGETAVVELDNPIGSKEVSQAEILKIAGRVIKGFLGVTGTVALVMFIYGGITWLLSGGNPDKIKKGKDVFVWAVLGLAIIFSSYFIVDFVIRALTAKV